MGAHAQPEGCGYRWFGRKSSGNLVVAADFMSAPNANEAPKRKLKLAATARLGENPAQPDQIRPGRRREPNGPRPEW